MKQANLNQELAVEEPAKEQAIEEPYEDKRREKLLAKGGFRSR